MKRETTALRLYGERDLRLESFPLPGIGEDEILLEIVTNSVCMSDYKAAMQGPRHKRVPSDVASNPVIIGHEFCGRIVEVGRRWKKEYREGERCSIQPAINYRGMMRNPGYSFPYCGGNSLYAVIPAHIIEGGGLLKYRGEAYFNGSLSEPVSCIVGTFHAMYHTKEGSYEHIMGIKEGGSLAVLAGVGPMGLGAIDYAVHNPRKPALIVVTDIDDARIERAKELLPPVEAEKHGVKLIYVNTRNRERSDEYLRSLTPSGRGFDDVILMAPVKALVEEADAILSDDGCLNFFAGPGDTSFSASINFYNVHYASHHLVGTSGGTTEDMIESLEMMSRGLLNPAAMITHIGGLDTAGDTILNLPSIPGGKKLIYTHIRMPLTAIADFGKVGASDPFFRELALIVERHKGLWSLEAEKYLLENYREGGMI